MIGKTMRDTFLDAWICGYVQALNRVQRIVMPDKPLGQKVDLPEEDLANIKAEFAIWWKQKFNMD